MSTLIDFLPLIAFLISFKVAGIYVATSILSLMSALQLAYFRIKDGKFTPSKVWLFLTILFFSGLTLYFRDDAFIKWKVTIIYMAFSIFLIWNYFYGKNPFIKTLFNTIDSNMQEIPHHIITKLTLFWVLTNFSFAFVNIYVSYYFSLSTWVNFKVWGGMGTQLVMIIISLYFIFPYFPEETETETETASAAITKEDI